MQLKLAKVVILIVILIFTTEWAAAAVTAGSVIAPEKVVLQSKPSKSIFTLDWFQKAEEENEESKDNRDKCVGVELIDLTRVVCLLSFQHVPHEQFDSYEEHYDTRPSLFTLHCVFLI